MVAVQGQMETVLFLHRNSIHGFSEVDQRWRSKMCIATMWLQSATGGPGVQQADPAMQRSCQIGGTGGSGAICYPPPWGTQGCWPPSPWDARAQAHLLQLPESHSSPPNVTGNTQNNKKPEFCSPLPCIWHSKVAPLE